jgi:hypothetical protein
MSTLGDQIAQLVQEFQEHDAKFEGGNAAAGTRARKTLMDIKKLCDSRRKEIQNKKNAA